MEAELLKRLEESGYIKKPMEPDLQYSAQTRWLKKPVSATRKLALASDFYNLRMEGAGFLSIDKDIAVSGEGSVKLELPIKYMANQGVGGRCRLFRPLNYEDIRMYNRLSFWIRVDLPTKMPAMSISISLHNEGEQIMPKPGRFEGTHSVTVRTGEWQQVVWEFPYCYRDKSTGFSIGVGAGGTTTPVGAGLKTLVYIDDMRLEAVEEDNYKGFDLRKDAIAYCHSGYRHGSVKQAMVQHIGGLFELKDGAGNTVFSGKSTPLENGFEILDFSAFDKSGSYTLHIANLSTNPFVIGNEAYVSAAWKALNFFFAERCGFDVPGIHAVCHQDVMSEHPDGRRMSVAGGWHDAADLTQGMLNTAECVYAMLELADTVKKSDIALYNRTMEEARWGLNWLMRTRWGDGFRHCGQIIRWWTKNIFGDVDDIVCKAENRPNDNFVAAGVCAKAYNLFKDDGMFSAWCEHCAKEDFYFAVEGMNISVNTGSAFTQLQLTAQAGISAMELYIAFNDDYYLEYAARFARIIMDCQQKKAPESFKYPISGYFYENEKKSRVQTYFHRTYEHAPVKALAMLLKHAPEHKDANLWRESLELYAGYVKSSSGFAPYGLLPNGIYEIGNTDYSTIYHEGSRVGMPSMEEYDAQVKNGVQLDDTHYLRIFPVAYQFRGFYCTLMGRTLAAFEIYLLNKDKKLLDIATRQMEWMLGFNPHASSGVYGEGYDYHQLSAGSKPQIVGAVPVGMVETFENEDLPFYPMQNSATYKEIWVHTTCRFMWLIAHLFKQ